MKQKSYSVTVSLRTSRSIESRFVCLAWRLIHDFVQIHLDNQMGITSTECECPRGEFKCSHAAALFIYGIHNLSRTDMECQWKRKKSSTSSHQSVSEMFPVPK